VAVIEAAAADLKTKLLFTHIIGTGQCSYSSEKLAQSPESVASRNFRNSNSSVVYFDYTS
jgi:hypothetical protein